MNGMVIMGRHSLYCLIDGLYELLFDMVIEVLHELRGSACCCALDFSGACAGRCLKEMCPAEYCITINIPISVLMSMKILIHVSVCCICFPIGLNVHS